MRLTNVLTLVLVVLLFSKCREIENTEVPNVPVNTVINIQTPEYFDLQAVGGWAYTYGGSKGIVVYRNSFDSFSAFDRHATYEPINGCIVEVDSSNIMVQDPCTTSRYLLTDGSVVNGPAVVGLRQYQAYFDGTYLRIYN